MFNADGEDEQWWPSETYHLHLNRETPLIGIFCHAKHAGHVVIERANHQQTLCQGAIVQLDDIHKAIPSLTESRLLDMPCNQVLFFWADSAAFQVERELERKPHVPGWSCKIIDSSNESVGNTGPMQAEHYDQTRCDRGHWEFIAISRRQLLHFEAIITVLQIDRQHDMAHRVNIGEVSEAAWNDAGPKRLLLALA